MAPRRRAKPSAVASRFDTVLNSLIGFAVGASCALVGTGCFALWQPWTISGWISKPLTLLGGGLLLGVSSLILFALDRWLVDAPRSRSNPATASAWCGLVLFVLLYLSLNVVREKLSVQSYVLFGVLGLGAMQALRAMTIRRFTPASGRLFKRRSKVSAYAQHDELVDELREIRNKLESLQASSHAAMQTSNDHDTSEKLTKTLEEAERALLRRKEGVQRKRALLELQALDNRLDRLEALQLQIAQGDFHALKQDCQRRIAEIESEFPSLEELAPHKTRLATLLTNHATSRMVDQTVTVSGIPFAEADGSVDSARNTGRPSPELDDELRRLKAENTLDEEFPLDRE